MNNLQESIKLKKFKNTSSTKLELQTLLWALNEIDIKDNKLIVYTDCQNILNLETRREYLELNNYFSQNNKRLNNYLLYQEFYKCVDKLNCEFIKVKGHKRKKEKNEIDNIFSLVDKASRQALRS